MKNIFWNVITTRLSFPKRNSEIDTQHTAQQKKSANILSLVNKEFWKLCEYLALEKKENQTRSEEMHHHCFGV